MSKEDDIFTTLVNELGEATEKSHQHKGPRNVPKPDVRKKKRREAKAKRKANRGKYSGQ